MDFSNVFLNDGYYTYSDGIQCATIVITRIRPPYINN